MKLIIGLGNPGKEYGSTRHNAGFLAVAAFSVERSAFSDWKFEKKFNAEIAEEKIDGERVILAKPQTFMNKSGEAARKIARFYKIKPADIWVIHDDLDLPVGALRIKIGGSSAGHQGVQSVIDRIGPEFVRFRIGIAPRSRKIPADQFVLKNFTPPEAKKIKAVISRITEAIPLAVSEGTAKAMSLFNRSL